MTDPNDTRAVRPEGRAVSPADVLIEGFGRLPDGVRQVVAGLGPAQILWRPPGRGNSIGWLIWHLARVEDDHVTGVVGGTQVWEADGWRDRVALPYAADAIGYGMDDAEVSAYCMGSADLLVGYHDAVHARTVEAIERLTDADLRRVVDERWDPPVTGLVRLVSVLNDATQHVGQAAYVRGLVEAGVA